MEPTTRRFLIFIGAAAFLLRLGARFVLNHSLSTEGGYSFYINVAENLVLGRGLCVQPGVSCALREPLYPLFLAPFIATHSLAWAMPIAEAAVGAGTAVMAWFIGCELFNGATGRLAAVAAAVNPYAVVHDTALQETVLVNAAVALVVWLLLRARSSSRPGWYGGGGIVLALAVLTTARMALLAPACVLWACLATAGALQVRLRHAVIVAVPIALLVGGWVARNWTVVGSPVLTTEAGESLWVANSDSTFHSFPAGSIDDSVTEMYAGLSAGRRAELDRLTGAEVSRDLLLAAWATDDIVAHPGRTIVNGARKIGIAFDGCLSPARGMTAQLGYALLFMPVHALAAIGLWRARHDWARQSLLWVTFLSFMITTAMFWAHTSHKSYLDVLLFVSAASVVRARG